VGTRVVQGAEAVEVQMTPPASPCSVVIGNGLPDPDGNSWSVQEYKT
jgi:hypothetical protein